MSLKHNSQSGSAELGQPETAPIKGDPFGESDALVAIQSALNHVPGMIPVARGMSFFGEHALGWMALAAAGAIVDKPRRRGWAKMGAAAFGSHAASVVVKRIVRRPRPHDPRIVIGVGTPSKLSFPSSHSTSTTAAMVGLMQLGAGKWPAVGIPAIMLSRLVLGVHYPSDVALGAALGATTAIVVDKIGDKVFDKAQEKVHKALERNAK